MATLIKIDRNGSKHFEGMVPCDRCGGKGGSEAWKYTGFTCYKCGGTGQMYAKWIERTPEYEAKLAERRAKRYAKMQAEYDAAHAEEKAQRELAERLEAERKAREEAYEAARKAVSKWQGNEGDKIVVKGTYEKSAWFDVVGPFGRPETRYVHTFKDVDGNVYVWKTGRGITEANRGEALELKGTVKEHSEYNGEKQTVLKNCRLNWIR